MDSSDIAGLTGQFEDLAVRAAAMAEALEARDGSLVRWAAQACPGKTRP